MTTTEQRPCRSNYHTDTGRSRDRGARLVECGLPAGHDGGDHDELLDGEPGVVTWPRRKPVPRVWAPTVIPADVLTVATADGTVWQRMPDGVDLWERPDLPRTSRGWVTTVQLLQGGPVTEVIGDGH